MTNLWNGEVRNTRGKRIIYVPLRWDAAKPSARRNWIWWCVVASVPGYAVVNRGGSVVSRDAVVVFVGLAVILLGPVVVLLWALVVFWGAVVVSWGPALVSVAGGGVVVGA